MEQFESLLADEVTESGVEVVDGQRAIIALFSTTVAGDWKQRYYADENTGVTSNTFEVLYLPDADVFWLNFGLEGSMGRHH